MKYTSVDLTTTSIEMSEGTQLCDDRPTRREYAHPTRQLATTPSVYCSRLQYPVGYIDGQASLREPSKILRYGSHLATPG